LPDTLVVDLGRIAYGECLEIQRRLVPLRGAGRVPDLLLLCEHPPVVTIGRSGGREHVGEAVACHGVPVVEVERGGDVTYHGPGQLVGYPILALRGEERDLHGLLRALEEVVIRTVADFGIGAERQAGLTGVWAGKNKLCAIGVAVRRWVTLHGFALNVNVDLQPFGWIVPCGLHGHGVTSMERLLGAPQDLAAVRAAVTHHFRAVFGRSTQPACLDDLDAYARGLPQPRVGEE
jgi:lipoate-protein ligase B